MNRPRATTLAVLVAAACGASPIESTSVFVDESSSSTGRDATTTIATTSTQTSDASESATTIADGSDESSTGIAATETTATSESNESSSDTGTPSCTPILHEVLYDLQSGDDELEWIELYNPCDVDIDLDGLELRWGGDGYVNVGKLEGTIGASGCFVVGGPMTNDDNYNPTFDQSLDFEADLENSGTNADGIALFSAGDDVPYDAVIYGEMNDSALIDETGMVGAVDVPNVNRGHSIARAAADASAAWYDEDVPTPNVCPNPGR